MQMDFIKYGISNSSELSNQMISESPLSMQIIWYRNAVIARVMEVENDERLVSKNW